MAVQLPHCQNIDPRPEYNCSDPFPNCSSLEGFNFGILWNYTTNVYNSCKRDPRLYGTSGVIKASKASLALTQKACVAVTGGGWKTYPRADIWARLVSWKFPLLQLVAIFPRPPLSVPVESFAVVHLLGDPIDTLANLLDKLSRCQHWAEHWQNHDLPNSENQGESWRALTLITDAYAEWEEDEAAVNALKQIILEFGSEPELKRIISLTANAIAADRATSWLPMIAAQVLFVTSIGISIFRTVDVANSKSSTFNTTIFINVEVWGIAFSALYFWIIPTVIFGCSIGVSQTEATIPRQLKRFKDDLIRFRPSIAAIGLPDTSSEDKVEAKKHKLKRKFRGGIYSWQPSRYRSQIKSPNRAQDQILPRPDVNGHNQEAFPQPRNENAQVGKRGPPNFHDPIFACLIVISGAVTAFIMTLLVPPGGWNCRHNAEVAIELAWIVSALLDLFFNWCFSLEGRERRLFLCTFMKDVVFALATVAGILLTVWGVLNQCRCYTNWGRTGLALPQAPHVDKVLLDRINWYIAIPSVGIFAQLFLVPLWLCWRRGCALRVYIQRDDDQSNFPKLLKVCGKRLIERSMDGRCDWMVSRIKPMQTRHLSAYAAQLSA